MHILYNFYTHVHACICMTCAYKYSTCRYSIYMYMYNMCTFTCTCICVCMCIRKQLMHIVWTLACTHANTHTHTHTHTHTRHVVFLKGNKCSRVFSQQLAPPVVTHVGTRKQRNHSQYRANFTTFISCS